MDGVQDLLLVCLKFKVEAPSTTAFMSSCPNHLSFVMLQLKYGEERWEECLVCSTHPVFVLVFVLLYISLYHLAQLEWLGIAWFSL
jgi:hypothetical protein